MKQFLLVVALFTTSFLLTFRANTYAEWTIAVLPNQNSELEIVMEPQTTFSLRSQVIGNGGSVASGGSFEVQGTIGQAMVGTHQGGNYSLISGFWHPLDTASNIYLPFIRR